MLLRPFYSPPIAVGYTTIGMISHALKRYFALHAAIQRCVEPFKILWG